MATKMGIPSPRFKMMMLAVKDSTGTVHTKYVNLPINERNEVYVGKTYLAEVEKLLGEVSINPCIHPQ
jgi:hypothetical protein